MNAFIKRSLAGVLLAALVLGGGLFLSAYAQDRYAAAREALQAVERAQTDLRQLQRQVEAYREAVGRLGWEPGRERRREDVALAAEFSQGQLGLLEEMLRSNYGGDGIFSVRHFQLASSRGEEGALTYQVDLQGENLLLFEGGAQ